MIINRTGVNMPYKKPLIEMKAPAKTRAELAKEVGKTLALGEIRDEYTRTYAVSEGLYHVLKDVPGEKEKILNNIPGMKDAEMEFNKKGDNYYIKITAVPKVSVAQLKKMKIIKTKPEESTFMEKIRETKLTPEQGKKVVQTYTEAFKKSFTDDLKKINMTPEQKKKVMNALNKAFKKAIK